MCCMALVLPTAAMATTQLARAASGERTFREVESTTIRKHPLRMSWVVVVDRNGERHLRMRWTADRE
jgi:hypothetical protein